MTALLIALLGALLVPLFMGTWRTSLFGLGCQGLLAGAIALRLHPNPHTYGEWLQLFDLVVVRGIAAPMALRSVLLKPGDSNRADVDPPNLFTWTLAIAIVLVSFRLAARLCVEPGEQRTLVAVAASSALLGLLVLAGQSKPFGQMMGALRIENAIVLLELGGRNGEPPLPVHLGLVGTFVGTMLLFRWYLGTLGSAEIVPVEPRRDSKAPTL